MTEHEMIRLLKEAAQIETIEGMEKQLLRYIGLSLMIGIERDARQNLTLIVEGMEEYEQAWAYVAIGEAINDVMLKIITHRVDKEG